MALHDKAKGSPNFRFYALYDKVYREDVLAFAYECCKANRGAAGVDGQTFEDIEEYGLKEWLDELTQELKKMRCGLPDRRTVPAAGRPRISVRAPGNQERSILSCGPPLRVLSTLKAALRSPKRGEEQWPAVARCINRSRLAGRFQRYQRSNRSCQDAIGASLTRQAGDVRRTQVKVRGGSYLFYHHSRILLGLGNRERIDCLEVKWPLLGGETQRFKDLPIDRYIAIVEGEEKWKQHDALL